MVAAPLILKLLAAGYGGLLLIAGVVALVRRLRWLAVAVFTVAVGWFLSLALQTPLHVWHQPQWGIFGADVVVLIGFAALTTHYRNRWLLTLTGLQTAAVALHIAYALLPRLSGAAYAGAGQILSWAVIGTLLAAAALARMTPAI